MLKVCCDFCDRAIEVEYSEDFPPMIKLFRTKEIDTKKLYPHLCESCANKIDAAIRYNYARRVRKSELAARYAKINEERRKRLNMKG